MNGSSTPSSRYGVPPALPAGIRVAVAAVWIYEGLWLKLLRPPAHELAVVQSVAVGPFTPEVILAVVGGGETLLGLGVLSGWFCRPLALVQGALLVAMNAIGILFGGGAIADPVGLVVHNLPLLLCIIVLGTLGPGEWVPGGQRRRS